MKDEGALASGFDHTVDNPLNLLLGGRLDNFTDHHTVHRNMTTELWSSRTMSAGPCPQDCGLREDVVNLRFEVGVKKVAWRKRNWSWLCYTCHS